MDIYTYNIPESYLNYFVNGEIEGLSDTDLENIKLFELQLIKEYGHAILSYPDVCIGFKYYNDVNNFGDNVYQMTITKGAIKHE